jgi:hypothetical protein
MIRRRFPQGARAGRAEYLLGHGRRSDPREPKLLLGNIEEVEDLNAACPWTYSRHVEVLSFYEDLGDDCARAIAPIHRAVLFGGHESQFSAYYIRHREMSRARRGQRRTAIHCVASLVHLPSGRQLNPDMACRHRFDIMRDWLDTVLGTASPLDRDRIRKVVPPSMRHPAEVRARAAELQELISGFHGPEPLNPEKIADYASELGLEGVVRRAGVRVSIPDTQGKLHWVLLKGEQYEQRERTTENTFNKRTSRTTKTADRDGRERATACNAPEQGGDGGAVEALSEQLLHAVGQAGAIISRRTGTQNHEPGLSNLAELLGSFVLRFRGFCAKCDRVPVVEPRAKTGDVLNGIQPSGSAEQQWGPMLG